MNEPIHIISLGSQPKPKCWRGIPIQKRFALQIVIAASGCWEWTGAISKNGYGVIARNGHKLAGAHRVAYELFKGPVPTGMELDHKCRNRKCVNPEHLEPVTHSENVMRGVSPPALRRKSGHCIRGHPMTPENRDIKKRRCKVCQREKAQERWARTHPNYGKNPNYIKNPEYHVHD